MAFDVEEFLKTNLDLAKARRTRNNAGAARQAVRENIRDAQELAAEDSDTFPLSEYDVPYFKKLSLQYDPTKLTDLDTYRNSKPTWGLTPAAKSTLQSLAFMDAIGELLENPEYVRYSNLLEELEAAKNAPELNPVYEYIPEGLDTPEVEQMRQDQAAKVEAQTAARRNLNRLQALINAPENKNAAKYKKDIDKLLVDPRVVLYLENRGIPEDISYFSDILAGNDIHNPPHKMIIDTYNNFYDKLMDIKKRQDVREANELAKKLDSKLNTSVEEEKDDSPKVIQKILPNGDLFVYYSDKSMGTQMGGMLKGKLDPKTGTYKMYHADINQGDVTGREKLFKQYGGREEALNNPEFIEKYISADTYHNGPGKSIDGGNIKFTEDTGTSDPKEALKKLVNTASNLTRSETKVENRHSGNRYKDVQTKTDDFIKFGDFDYSTGKGTKGLLSMTKGDAINWYKDKYKLDDKKAEAYVNSLLKKYKLDVIKNDPSLDGAGRIIEGGSISNKDLLEPRSWTDPLSVEEVNRRRQAYLAKLTENSKIRLNNLRDSIVKLNNKLTDTSLSPEEREKLNARLSKLLEKNTRFNDKYKFGEDSEGNTTMTVTYKPEQSKNIMNDTNKYKKNRSLVAGDRSYGEREALEATRSDIELAKENRKASFNDLMRANNELLALENELSVLRSEKKAIKDQDEKEAKTQEIAQKTAEVNAQKQEVKALKKTFSKDTSELNSLDKKQKRLQKAVDKQTNAEIGQLRDYTTDVPLNRKLTGKFVEEKGNAPEKKGTDTYKYTLDGDKTLNEAKAKEAEEKAEKEEKLNNNILAVFERLRR